MTPPSSDTIRAALACIPPDLPRDEWARVAMALKSWDASAGLDLFDEWSKGGGSYSKQATRDTWRSVKAGGPVTIGTLLHLAQQHGFKFETVQTPAPRPTPAQLKAQADARRAEAQREASERSARHREAAEDAARLWAEAADSGDSPYLLRKGVSGHGVRFAPGRVLLVPMRDAAGELHNVQSIKPERPADGGPEKLFRKGGRKVGLMHWCGSPVDASVLLVAEGYATAASLHEATGLPACVAFDAGNLVHVARALRGKYRVARFLVCGDDDRDTEARTGRNPGREKAIEAAKLLRGAPVFPEGLNEGASDFNDMHQAVGAEAVRGLIERALQAHEGRDGGQPIGERAKAAPAARQTAARGADDDQAHGPGRYDRFRVDDDGLWFDAPADDSGSGARPVRVCGALAVTALARDVHDNGAALLLEFDTPFRKGRRWLMPLAMLAGDGTAYRAELLGQGFMVPTDAKRRALLTAYLQSRSPSDLVRIVDRVGWHGRAYVLPRETLGDDGGERIIFQSDAPIESTFAQRGTLEQWRERIGRLCIGNSRIAFAASCAFAGPLLAWAGGTDGGGVHFMGDSSCGKTTALRVAASVWGGRDYLQRWRATDNGLEGMAAQHSDSLLCLDELAQLDARVAGESAYMLANGQGKSRAGRTGTVRPRLTWRLLFLSAGEIGLAEHMSEANKRTRAGQELRMVDLPADAGAGMGVFESLHGIDGGGGAVAQYLSRATEATHGTPGRAWLEWLTLRTEALSRTLRERMEVIEAQLVPEAASGQVQRVGKRFALIAAAGELATVAELTGWPEGEATDAARRCFNAWIESRPGGIGLSEDAQMLRQMRGWFALHGDSRFKPWHRTDSDNKPNTPLMAGWRKEIEEDRPNSGGDIVPMVISREWFVMPDVFRTEACKGFHEKAALRLLADRGHLVREGKHFACRASPPGADKCSVYRVKSSLLGDVDD